MPPDNYRGAAPRWARGATLVYAPIAARLVSRSPVPLAGARVLDAGAGTGVSDAPLHDAGARVIVASDLSYDMLAFQRGARPPAVLSDVLQLPFVDASFDAAVASFVLNHLDDPVRGLRELARTLAPGGGLLATVYANSSRSATRDTIDEVARAHGWEPPDWYRELKAVAAPLLGTAELMGDAARAAGLADIDASEEAVDVHVRDPGALVDYRFGQANFTDWINGLDSGSRAAVRADAIAAIAGAMEPYCPRVVFLTARTARRTRS